MMRHKRTAPTLIMLIVAVTSIGALFSGCASSDDATTQWYQARHALTGTQDVIGVAHDSGLIDDGTLVNDIDPVVQAARGTLDKAKSYLPDGGPEFAILMDAMDEYLKQLKRQQMGANDDSGE